VIQALVQSQLQKHTSYPIQTKCPSISSIFVFLAQSFGNSFAQYRQSYAFAAARPVLQATDASSKFQISFQASKFDLLLVCARLVSKRRYSTRIRLRRGSCRVREKGRDAVARQSYKRRFVVVESNRMSTTCKIECECRIECRMDCSCASSK